MKSIAMILSVVFSSAAFGQSAIMVNDGDGATLGQAWDWAPNWPTFAVLRDDGLYYRLDTSSGVLDQRATPYFESEDCSGPMYMLSGIPTLTWEPVLVRMATIGGSIQPIIRADSQTVKETKTIRSKMTESQGTCDPEQPQERLAILVDGSYDPSDDGFVITPSGQWGRKPPFTFKQVKLSTAIFCNGFENCPQN